MPRRVARVGRRSGGAAEGAAVGAVQYARRSLGSSSSAVTSVVLHAAPNGEALAVILDGTTHFFQEPDEVLAWLGAYCRGPTDIKQVEHRQPRHRARDDTPKTLRKTVR
ncbi:hypothetical protein NDU88_010820 [Pleurodeles waltl]|uniref:Uncharacterized protein n=1 Tax=Pleurodeles waltl TaxID=8319 RepID=A0AAV7QVG2_PLEWA|nr:hypothetical protein NDU88_010820 [Pleurodeles waltl]